MLVMLRILRILWNPEVYFRTHKSPPLVPVLRQMNAVNTNPFYFMTHLSMATYSTSMSS
jgi:hypothetical protein